jgi:gas vesicle protein
MAATKTAPKPATGDGRSPSEYLKGALDELTKARERASGDIRDGIDSAIERTRAAMKDTGGDVHEQVSDWRSSLDKATDDVRRELGILAIRAQRSPEALRAMSAEIRKRKAEISPSK